MCPTLTWTTLVRCYASSGYIAEVRKKNESSSIKYVLLWSFSEKKQILRMDMVQISKDLKRLLQEGSPIKDVHVQFSAMEVSEVVFTHRKLQEQTRKDHSKKVII